MKVTPKLKAKAAAAVRTTMRIEGYTELRSEAERQGIRQLMGQQRVQVSVPRK